MNDDPVQRIYDKLPTMKCKGLCHESCGPAPALPAEAARMHKKGIEPPDYDRNTLDCNYLSNEKTCSIYDDRPLICRLFGMVKKMKCPHGCIPEAGMMSEQKSIKLIRYMENVRSGETR
tara:strand:+ start:10662 stop:11018 length:357 start_codon:yes stop_codon:yes gene_type:complete